VSHGRESEHTSCMTHPGRRHNKCGFGLEGRSGPESWAGGLPGRERGYGRGVKFSSHAIAGPMSGACACTEDSIPSPGIVYFPMYSDSNSKT
jgi:hypothetical protein